MQHSPWKSVTLVAIQLACLAGILLTGPLLAPQPLLLVAEAAAVALGLWALLTMRLENVQVLPDPRQGAQLVRHGPYRWIRHPMYSALLLGTLVLVLAQPTALRWAFWIVLLADLLIKLHYEERLLLQHFAGYAVYMTSSKRLVPYLY
jgi:protein-S-isoprenylcysteine O-methyltransferase Ste14